jgi:transcriptional regulator with XRE-family HTH domain
MYSTVGERIKAARKYRGMTSTELAERLHVSQSVVTRWEKGGRTCRLHRLTEIAAILNVPLSYLTNDRSQAAAVGRTYRGTWQYGRF